jgi:hypothetical protein
MFVTATDVLRGRGALCLLVTLSSRSAQPLQVTHLLLIKYFIFVTQSSIKKMTYSAVQMWAPQPARARCGRHDIQTKRRTWS